MADKCSRTKPNVMGRALLEKFTNIEEENAKWQTQKTRFVLRYSERVRV